ncbi:Zinc Finger Homeobox Protein 4 [Manis pentadactyla]|nr:Zinc Finger Homeobox Protein 4 [Manis pentadactyla]
MNMSYSGKGGTFVSIMERVDEVGLEEDMASENTEDRRGKAQTLSLPGHFGVNKMKRNLPHRHQNVLSEECSATFW